jgi:uroporphyrinogen decarboxylase
MHMRDDFLKTIRRQQDTPVPHFFCFCKTMVQKFERQYGFSDYRKHYNIPLQEIFLKPTKLKPEEVFSDFLQEEDKTGLITEWGIKLEKSSVAHFSHMVGPLRKSTAVKDVERLPLPDFLEDYRWEGVAEKIEQHKKNGGIVFPGIYGGTDTGTGEIGVAAFMDIFESSWYLRGLDNLLLDFYENEEFAEALLDKVTALKIGLAEKWTRAGVDILITADDVGTQTGLMMSLEMYRKWIKPRLKKIIDAAKAINPDVLIFYHSDGNIETLIPDLIEAGIEILNPIQPECMDPVAILKQYGDKLSFWGTVGTQRILPFGSIADVEKTCGKVLDAVKGKGGLILAPTHLVEPDVPLEKIEAMVNMVNKYNQTG